MNISLPDFRTRCLESALDLLWRQWCSLGVAGHSAPASDTHLIDPEALLLATTSLGRYEPRLFDEAFDWLIRFGPFINLQRLKNLQRLTGLGNETVLNSLATWLAARAAQPRWKALAKSTPRASTVEPLFPHTSGPAPSEADPIFLAHGLQRGSFHPRGMSRAPNPLRAANLIFSLRALIGVSARVEVILCLAGGTPAHASEIARMTGYAPRTLQSILQEMSLSGHLLSQEPPISHTAKIRRGANRRYQVQPADWSFLTGGKSLPRWLPWTAIFTLIRQVLIAIPAADQSGKHPAVISANLRTALATHGQALSAAGLLPALDLRSGAPGDELLQTLATRLPAIIADL